MIADVPVAGIATVGAVAAFLVGILVRLAAQRRTTHRQDDKTPADARLNPSSQQALVDDPDISVPPLSGFDLAEGHGAHPVPHGAG